MTDDDIIALAVGYGLGEIEQDTAESEPHLITGYGDIRPGILEFARALLAAEREACALALETRSEHYWSDCGCDPYYEGRGSGVGEAAEMIRARGK